MPKRLLLVAALAILLSGGVWWYLESGKETQAGLVLFGNVDIRQVSLAFTGSERIAQMNVDEGDVVKAGDILAVLDTRTLRLEIDKTQAQIAVQQQNRLRLANGSRPEDIARAKAQEQIAQAQLDLANTQLKRLQNIRENSLAGKAVSQQDLDNATAQQRVAAGELKDRQKALRLAQIGPRTEDIDQAQAQLNAARADLALLNHNLDEANLKAPQNAVVRSRLLEPGDLASPQRPVYALTLTDPKWIRAYINETGLGRIKPGMPAKIYTDSHPDEPIDGHIGFISSVAEFTPKSVQTEDLRTSLVYEVRVLVADPNNRLRLGMPATVRIDDRAL